MRRMSLPPVGALTHTNQIKPGDTLILVSPCPRDALITALEVSPEGVQIEDGDRPLMTGLNIVQRQSLYPFRFCMVSLNLVSDSCTTKNDYNNAYLFKDEGLALKYAKVCSDRPDTEVMHRYPDGGQRSRSVLQHWQSEWAKKKPTQDQPTS